jgi:hypothetical protein
MRRDALPRPTISKPAVSEGVAGQHPSDAQPRTRIRASRRVGLLLAAGRCAVSLILLVAPEAALRAQGSDAATARRSGWLARMLGARDLTLALGAAGSLRTSDQDGRLWLLAGAASDAVDAAVSASGISSGRLGRLRGGALTVIGAGAALAGVVAAVAGSPDRSG